MLTVPSTSKNVLGMSIVGSDFEELKQFNLAEIYDPTAKPSAEKNKSISTPSAEKSDPPRDSIFRSGDSTATPTSGGKTSDEAVVSQAT